MLKLFLDSSNQYLFLNLFDNNDIIFHYCGESFNKHSENLIVRLNELLLAHNILPSSIDEIYVGMGPGSYTGVRVSCTVAKVFSYLGKKNLFSFSSLDLLVSQSLHENGVYLVTMNAKKGMVYAKVLEVLNNVVKVVLDECFVSEEEIVRRFSEATRVTEHINSYNACDLIKYHLVKKVDDIHSFTPLYLRSGV